MTRVGAAGELGWRWSERYAVPGSVLEGGVTGGSTGAVALALELTLGLGAVSAGAPALDEVNASGRFEPCTEGCVGNGVPATGSCRSAGWRRSRWPAKACSSPSLRRRPHQP